MNWFGSMNRFFQRSFLALALAGSLQSASAFSLLGPAAGWEVPAIAYMLPGDIGGPMLITEG